MKTGVRQMLTNIFINRDYGLLFMGRLVSQIGDGVYYFALVWLVLDLTGSGTALGSLLFIASLPAILLAPFTGVFADVADRKKIVVSMDVVRGTILLVLALLYALDNLTLPILYVATMILSVCGVFFGPAISATIPNLVQRDELVKANARDSLSMSATGILGPIVGAFLLATTGYLGIFLINGCSFLISALSEAFIRFPAFVPRSTTELPMKRFKQDFLEGFRFILGEKGLRTLIFCGILLNCTMGPVFSVIFPYLGKEVLVMKPEHYGLVQSSFPFGMLVGTFIVAFLVSKLGKARLLGLGITNQGLLMGLIGVLAFPFVHSVLSPLLIALWFGLAIFFMGLSNVQVNVPLQVTLQERVPDAFRGRVSGLLGSALQVLTPIFMALYGVGVDIFPPYVFLFLGAFTAVSLGLLLGLSEDMKRFYAVA